MVRVGRPLPDSNEPSTTGGPSGTRWMSARPPKARTVASPSSAQRSRSPLRSGPADTLGIPTNSFSICSKRSFCWAAYCSSWGRVNAMPLLLGPVNLWGLRVSETTLKTGAGSVVERKVPGRPDGLTRRYDWQGGPRAGPGDTARGSRMDRLQRGAAALRIVGGPVGRHRHRGDGRASAPLVERKRGVDPARVVEVPVDETVEEVANVEAADAAGRVGVAHDVDGAAVAQEVIELRTVGQLVDPLQVHQEQPPRIL